MATIFDISIERKRLMLELEACEGELSESLEEALSINNSDFEEKCEAYCHFISLLASEQALADAEIDRLKAHKERKAKARERLEKRLLEALLVFGQKDPKKDIWRRKAGTYELSTRKNPSSIEIEDESLLPFEYFRTPEPPKPVPDKKAIKEAIEKGQRVSGAKLKEGELKISIK